MSAETARLQRKLAALRAALGEFEHEARRINDALERAGGGAHGLQARQRQLADNMRLSRLDIEKTQAALAALQKRAP